MAYGYVIVDMNISDMDAYKQYMAAAPASIQAAGGEYLVRGGQLQAMEGDWQPRRLVMLEFPSMAQAQAWLDSPEYAPARRLRQLSANSRMVVIDGALPA